MTPADADRLKAQVEAMTMGEIECIIYRDRVESLTLGLLQNVAVRAGIVSGGIELWLEFAGFGRALIVVPWVTVHRADELLRMWLSIEIGYRMMDLCREKYYQK